MTQSANHGGHSRAYAYAHYRQMPMEHVIVLYRRPYNMDGECDVNKHDRTLTLLQLISSLVELSESSTGSELN